MATNGRMTVLKLVFVPLALFSIGGCLIIWTLHQFPFYTSIILCLLVICGLIRFLLIRKKDRLRGWRVGPKGRDEIYYDELVNGKWCRIILYAELQSGKVRRVINLTFHEAWTQNHRNEIILRIKSMYPPPDYEYHGD
jgi:hypothetical protein